MVNGLNLYSSLLSSRTSKLLYITISHSQIHTMMVISYIVAAAALGQTERSSAAIQLAPLTTTNKIFVSSILPKDTTTKMD